MRIVAITRILNEADIVEAFVRHTAALVDHHILLDNGSTDATLAILAALRAEGLSLEVHHSPAIAFAEAEQNQFLYRRAHALGAGWVLPLDTDEFVDTRGLNSALLQTLDAQGTDAVNVRVREYIATDEDDAAELVIPNRIIYARPPSDNFKVILRTSLLADGAALLPGGHGVRLAGEPAMLRCPVLDGVLYAHYATRSPWQWVSKFTVGWSKVLAAGSETIAAGHSSHYREPFRILATDPSQILRNPYFMAPPAVNATLSIDPIWYLGGDLRHTAPVDYQMRAVQAVIGHVQSLSTSIGQQADRDKRVRATLRSEVPRLDMREEISRIQRLACGRQQQVVEP